MAAFRILKLCAPLGGAAMSLVPVVRAAEESQKPKTRFVKPSELPLYDDTKEEERVIYYCDPPSKLEKGVSEVRKVCTDTAGECVKYKDACVDMCDTCVRESKGYIDYLQDPENAAARVGAVAGGALFGIIVASRKGFFRKLVYGTIGAGAVASVLYPEEAAELRKEIYEGGSDVGKKYALIAYNFLFGMKPEQSDCPPKQTAEEVRKK